MGFANRGYTAILMNMPADDDLRLAFLHQFKEPFAPGMEAPHDTILVAMWWCMRHQNRVGGYKGLDFFQACVFIKTDAGAKWNWKGAADSDKGDGLHHRASGMYRDTVGKGLKEVVDSFEVAIAANDQNRYRQSIESA